MNAVTKASGEAGIRPVTAELAQWVSQLSYEDLPPAVVAHIKLCILDSIGCGIYGAAKPWGKIASDVAVELSNGGAATLFGRRETASPTDAAMANGTAIHGFEIDDLHVAGMAHPGSVTVPAALAAAESSDVSGREFLVGVVAGYEAGIRVGLAAGVKHATSGYHGASTIGSFCAAAAVARVFQLDPEAAANALGIAGTQSAGLYSARQGAMSKRFHAGRAAFAGVLSGFLARRGFTGSREVIEAPFGGFMSTMNGESDPATILDRLGEHWETLRVGFKAYAACGSTHTTIDALDIMMRDGLRADNLERLTVSMTKKAMTNVGWTYTPGAVVSAQMNGYYAAAVKIIDNDAFIDQFREERLADPRILALIPKIELRHDPELDAGGAAKRHSVRVEARLTDGRVLHTEVEQRKGSAEKPLSAEEVTAKFRRLAATTLSEDAIDGIVSAVNALETAQDLHGLAQLTRA